MTEARRAAILDEAIQPHLSTEEGQVFLAGLARLEKTQATLAQQSPAGAQHLKDLILRFMWEQIPTREMQQELQTMFSDSCLQDRSILSGIQPFLEAPTNTPGEQAAAKRLLCAHFGLVTQKGDAQSQARLQEAMQFQLDIEDHFKDQPGKYEEFLRLGFRDWREGRRVHSDARQSLVEVLQPAMDLVARFEAIWKEAPTEQSLSL